MIRGQDRAVAQFLDAWESGRIHHAWLLAGPRGVGKASFARAAARRVLADSAGPARQDGLNVPDSHPTSHLLAAGSHPDFRLLERLEKTTGLARNIGIDQVRGLAPLLGVTPSLSPWRVIVIDSADDLESSAANALLKMLEEPPANSIFLLVAHSVGRLLPTIRSRCRRLDFEPLPDDVMASLLGDHVPSGQRDALIAVAGGSIGRALQAATLDLAPLEAEARAIMAQGDGDNSGRSRLAGQMTGKAAGERYAAFLARIPSIIAEEARTSDEPRRSRALDAYDRARELAALAPRLTLDPAATMFEIGSLLASIGSSAASLKR